MKNTVLSVAITIASFAAATAQPTLTAATCNPVAGDIYIGHDLNVVSLTPGSSGANITWNYGSLVGGALDTTTFMTCIASPYCDSFSGSNLVSFDQTDYTYLVVNATKLSAIGGYSSPDYIHFTDPKDFLRYPFTYHSGYKDTTDATTGGLSLRFIDTTYADGYGTLILPTGTFINVIRMHTITVSVFSVGGSPVGGDSTETYNWYKPGFHSPLMTAELDTTGGTMHVVKAKYNSGPAYTTAVADVANNSAALNVFPNPATGQVHITFNLANTTDASVTIADLTGRTVTAISGSSLTKGANDIAYSVAELPSGMYILHLHTNEGNVSQKFVVSK